MEPKQDNVFLENESNLCFWKGMLHKRNKARLISEREMKRLKWKQRRMLKDFERRVEKEKPWTRNKNNESWCLGFEKKAIEKHNPLKMQKLFLLQANTKITKRMV